MLLPNFMYGANSSLSFVPLHPIWGFPGALQINSL